MSDRREDMFQVTTCNQCGRRITWTPMDVNFNSVIQKWLDHKENDKSCKRNKLIEEILN
jgi:hypothetical protein